MKSENIPQDTINLINHSVSTFLDIAQMTLYRQKYVQDGNAEDKQKMYMHVFLAGFGILSLFTMGLLGLMESYKDDIFV